MNTTEEQDEPLGEAPVLTGFQLMGTDHLTGGVDSVLAAADRVTEAVALAERQTRALDEIREMHKRCWLIADRYVCETCRDVDGDPIDYPCPTVAILDRLA